MRSERIDKLIKIVKSPKELEKHIKNAYNLTKPTILSTFKAFIPFTKSEKSPYLAYLDTVLREAFYLAHSQNFYQKWINIEKLENEEMRDF